LRDAVATTPGWQLLSLERGQRWALRLLRDPDAAASDDLAARAGIAADQLVVEEIPYLALDDAALARRLARAVSPPPDVQMVVVDGIATVRGSAPAPWVAQLAERAPLLAGIRAVAIDGLVATPDPALEQEWQALRADVEGMRVLFVRGGTQVRLDTTLQLAAAMRRALELGRMLERPLSFQVQGWSDEGGSEQRNQALRARRAEALHRSLLAAGVAAGRIALAPDDPAPNAPSAGVRWIEGDRR
jgi:outer membrane protein OmpA-like peptidoglycan-associated protein